MRVELSVDSRRILGRRDPKIFGQFIEHFHRQVYGGIYDPGSKLADGEGLRADVLAAIRRIAPPVIRWPGGCFVSAYHWKDGVGPNRRPRFDKAWRVEESNAFGTDEFVAFCRKAGAEPYICTNAGTGSPEEMSDWVEYCNLEDQGHWARQRIQNGHRRAHRVKYWSIGNENYGDWEIGAKTAHEWGRFVKESAKMMKAVDPSIELMAASVPELDWNFSLLREAGKLLDWISIHGYWDPLWEKDEPGSYETCMAWSAAIGEKIDAAEHILGALELGGRARIAFDEWNLRGWHHPNRWSATEDFLTPRDKNDENRTYTMADAVFSACFLNACLRHCATVGMANFAPLVNARGAIFTHAAGIVLRPTYFVFELYTRHMGEVVVDSWLQGGGAFAVPTPAGERLVPAVDAVATRSEESNELRIAIANRHPEETVELSVRDASLPGFSTAVRHELRAPSKDAFNDVSAPATVALGSESASVKGRSCATVEVPPHSVMVLVLTP